MRHGDSPPIKNPPKKSPTRRRRHTRSPARDRAASGGVRTAVHRALLAATLLALGARTAGATAIQDLVRIKGLEENLLTGMGIVVGLSGTGDSSKASFAAARPYARLLSNLGNPLSDLRELAKADAYAIVAVTMRVPASGVREGDRLDVHVDKLFNAKSLAGGRLVASLLRLPGPDSPALVPMAIAEGPLVIVGGDLSSAVVRDGGQMLADVRMNPIASDGSITLVLKEQYAVYPVAATIAGAIDDEFAAEGLSSITEIEDGKNVRVYLPEADLRRPARFIAALLEIPIDPSLIRTEARIVVNARAGIITITGNVEIGPVAITHKGMQLTSLAPPPAPGDPAAAPAPALPRRWVGLDTTGGVGRPSTRLADLLLALDRLEVSTDDQIAILHELRKTGALHAEIVSE
jgi:flagellar P-ring protein precursor FlgI